MRNKNRRFKKPAANTMYVFDVSGSMNSEISGYNGSSVRKIDALKEAFTVLLNHKAKFLRQDLVGCILYSTHAEILFKPTNPRNPWILQKVAQIKAGGTTNMAAGLELAIEVLENRHPKYLRNITLLSDGIATCSKDAVIKCAHRAFKSRIRVNTIGFGSGREIDEDLLTQVANTTHKGHYSNARDLQALAQALLRAA